MAKHPRKSKSTLPIYAFGLSFLLFSLAIPLSNAYIVAGALVFSGCMALGAKLWAASSTKKETPPPKPEPKAEPSVQEAPLSQREKDLAECELYFDAIKRYAEQAAFRNLPIADELAEMEKSMKNILDDLRLHPEDLPQMYKFLSHYMPTTIKLLKTYLEVVNLQGDNISNITTETEGMLHTMTVALDKQLNKLYENDAMDIRAEVTVLNQMLKQEGLSDQPTPTPKMGG